MSVEELDKAMKDSAAMSLTHMIRNDLLAAHSILLQATKLLVEAQHRLNETMVSLVSIEECHVGKSGISNSNQDK